MTTSSPHILYVDDDEALRRLVERALSRRGFKVSLAENGYEALDLAESGDFDLIAIDHYMPGLDGLATLQKIQALRVAPPLVYVTGSEETQVAVAALKAGAADYVVKTVGEDFFDLLASTFRQALDKVELRKAKEAAEEELRASHARLEALLKEVNHRVTNSLQLVSAFVHMQASSISDSAAKDALVETQQRIQAIAQVHRRLYSSGDVEYVSMDDYLAALVAEMEQTWSTPASRRRLTLNSDPIRLKTDRAISLGIIVNELVSNACKYAYASGAEGEVRVSLSKGGNGHFTLCVEDDGPGLKEGPPQGTGLGTKLIKAMAGSLDARLHYDDSHNGVRACIEAPC